MSDPVGRHPLALPNRSKRGRNAAAPKTRLSKSELGALRLVDSGLSNQEIAVALAITVGTVKWHLHQIFGKLEVRNRTAAAAKARRQGLI